MIQGRVFLALFLAGLAWGCRDIPAESNILSGQVTYGGEPLCEGLVTLMGPNDQIANSTIKADGTYRIVNPPQGLVRLAVNVYPKMVNPLAFPPVVFAGPIKKSLAHSDAPLEPQVLVPARYSDPLISGITCQVGPGQQVFDIQLISQKDDPPVVKKAAMPRVGLKVGQEAPNIEGEDQNGVPCKLSDYRGQVVVVLFWGHW